MRSNTLLNLIALSIIVVLAFAAPAGLARALGYGFNAMTASYGVGVLVGTLLALFMWLEITE